MAFFVGDVTGFTAGRGWRCDIIKDIYLAALLMLPAASLAETVIALSPAFRFVTATLHVVDVGYVTAPIVAVEDVIIIVAVSDDFVPVRVCED